MVRSPEPAPEHGTGSGLAEVSGGCGPSRGFRREAGTGPCRRYAGRDIGGTEAPPRHTGPVHGLLPAHACSRTEKTFRRRQGLRAVRRGRRPGLAPARRLRGRDHHGLRHPQHFSAFGLLQGNGPRAQTEGARLHPRIRHGEKPHLARALQLLSETGASAHRQAVRRRRRLQIPRQNHHRIPGGGCPER